MVIKRSEGAQFSFSCCNKNCGSLCVPMVLERWRKSVLKSWPLVRRGCNRSRLVGVRSGKTWSALRLFSLPCFFRPRPLGLCPVGGHSLVNHAYARAQDVFVAHVERFYTAPGFGRDASGSQSCALSTLKGILGTGSGTDLLQGTHQCLASENFPIGRMGDSAPDSLRDAAMASVCLLSKHRCDTSVVQLQVSSLQECNRQACS